MLLRLLINNFLSFDEEMQFDMFPNMKRTSLATHIYTENQIPVLKQAAIYGQNGAGKSNIVKALEFIKAFAINKSFLQNIEVDKFFYRLKPDFESNPISLVVEFENNKQYFIYSIEIGVKEIKQEMLCESFPLDGNFKVIYNREGNEIEYSEDVQIEKTVLTATKTLVKKNPLSSVMALNREFPIIQDKRCYIATSWFEKKLEIIGVNSIIPSLIDLLRTNEKIMEFSKELIPSLAVGVQDINVVDEDFDNWAQHHIQLANSLPEGIDKVKNLSLNSNSTPILSIKAENSIKKVYQLMFEHSGKNGFIGNLDASSQSDGTLRALTLLPALYCATKMNKTVVIDEINCCLSPTMVKGIVEYFANTGNTNGQLIFTTHDNQLLDEKNLLRSDEVWFVDKKEGASILYSHNDFKEHHTISMMRGYNEGRFGAIRFINLTKNGQE